MKPWVLAIGLSLALHLGLVLVFRDGAPSPPRGERVGVRGEPFVAFTPVRVIETARPAQPERRLSPRPTVVAAAAPAASPLPEPVLEAVAGVEGVEGVEGAGGAGGVEGVDGGEAATASSPHPDPRPARGEGDAVIALVHARLAAVADRCYPAAARRFRQRGTVQLSFCTDAAGAAANTAVTQSSGAELLDAAARGCVVEQASPFPHEAASRCFAVPVRFGAR